MFRINETVSVVRSRSIVIFSIVFGVFAAGCSSTSVGANAIAKGNVGHRCETNEDCNHGLRCQGGSCEDIYHPRDSIRNY